MSSHTELDPAGTGVVVDLRGPGEWIVHPPAAGRSLHVYRLARADWLVSEVGCGNEGRGADLQHALSALSAGVAPPAWWSVVAVTLCRVMVNGVSS
jgi:hypothetical protein